jgi:hypothetical protein
MSTDPLANLFDDPDSWAVFASGQAEGKIKRIEGPGGKSALRLNYDFHGGGGFIVIRKVVRVHLPETFEIKFSLQGKGLPNQFEFKLADPSGANAWRFLHSDFHYPAKWSDCRVRERDLPFAWGPAGGGAPTVVGAIELVIAAGLGGSGHVCFSDMSLEDQTLYMPKEVTASSHQPNFPPESVFESSLPSGWRADSMDLSPRWSADFGRLVRFGGMVITWPAPTPARSFEIEISCDGKLWTRIHQASHARGLKSHIPAPGAEARYLRMNFTNPESAAFVALDLRPDAFSATPNEFIHAVATDYPRGWFPRYWYREQSYWTPVGSPEGRRRSLVNEEGMVEVDEAGFSLEPFLQIGGKLITWADVEIEKALPSDGVPMPSVTWRTSGLELTILPWLEGSGDQLILRIRYVLVNESGKAHDVKLVVAARPYQVNPPWQAFRNLGGRSPIHRIVCNARGFGVGGLQVHASSAANSHGAAAFEEGGVVESLSRGVMPYRQMLEDNSGLASGALSWDIPSEPSTFEVTVSFPFYQPAIVPSWQGWDRTHAHWQSVLEKVKWDVSGPACDAIACFRTAAAHILINRDGPAIQPGPRRYTRSWIRDCVIMGAALAKAGLPHALRDFLQWYVQFQREDGHVPCVVDRDGVDTLVEHDSHGQFLWAIREVLRTDRDLAFVRQLKTPVKRAAEYLLCLRGLRKSETYQKPEHSECYGLLPESASHEGYLAHPVHSYWDDFWGIRGLEAAADLAEAIGDIEDANLWRAAAEDFCGDVIRSINKVIEHHQLEYIPGSVEWADFDPTATANAIAQLDFCDALPAEPLNHMMETYLEGFRRKHRGEVPWNNYTAYEIRIIGAFVRMGRREEAHELLEFFLSDRRPLEWNQWPEISWRDPKAPGHLGDVPHTWIAAEFILGLASMVASERDHSLSMVLAAGLSWAWISQEDGFGVRGLPTHYGPLDFHIEAYGEEKITVRASGISLPPGGLTLAPPLPPGALIESAIDDDGNPIALDSSGRIATLTKLPFSAVLHLRPDYSPSLS